MTRLTRVRKFWFDLEKNLSSTIFDHQKKLKIKKLIDYQILFSIKLLCIDDQCTFCDDQFFWWSNFGSWTSIHFLLIINFFWWSKSIRYFYFFDFMCGSRFWNKFDIKQKMDTIGWAVRRTKLTTFFIVVPISFGESTDGCSYAYD